MKPEELHLWIEIVTPICVVAVFVLNLIMKNSAQADRAEIVQRQNEMQIDMNNKHAENQVVVLYRGDEPGDYPALSSGFWSYAATSGGTYGFDPKNCS